MHSGEPVQAAGMFIAEQGRLMKLFPHSGHYRPEERQFAWLLRNLQDFAIDLRDVLVDAQRIYKVSRQTPGNEFLPVNFSSRLVIWMRRRQGGQSGDRVFHERHHRAQLPQVSPPW